MTGWDMEIWGSLVFFEHKVEVIIAIVIFLIVWGKFLPVIVASHCAELSMSMHGTCACHEIVKAVGANEAQVVVCSLQMVYHCPFILAFFPTPQAEG